jgi:hypothetical protein
MGAAFGFLLRLAEPQRGHADSGQWQRRLGRFGLGFPAQQPVADSLELLFHEQLCLVQVDQFPGQAEYLAFAQAEHEDKHVSRI